MKCEKVKECLIFLGDGSLDENTENCIKKHLELCPECRREYNEISTMITMVRSTFAVDETDTPIEFAEMVNNRINRKKTVHRIYKVFFSAAAVLVIAVLISFYDHFIPMKKDTALFQKIDSKTVDDFITYVAERDCDTYELLELVEFDKNLDKYSVNDESLLKDIYFGCNVEDIIECMDDKDIVGMLSEI